MTAMGMARKQMNRKGAGGRAGEWTRGLVIAGALGSMLAITPSPLSAQEADGTAPGKAPTSSEQTEAPADDWREAFLEEMGALANELEEQRHFNNLLRDRIDILTQRIEELESEAEERDTARAPVPPEPIPDAPVEPDVSEKSSPDAEAGGDEETTARSLSDSFEAFLDRGEAMMRRFFGVVNEFRKDFEGNRA